MTDKDTPADDQRQRAARGGQARARALTPAERSDIASKAAVARWAKEAGLPKATHEGTLKIGDVEFTCYVLEDGTRVISETRFMEGMGMYRSGALSTRREADTEGSQVPLYLAYKNLKAFVKRHLGDVFGTQFRFVTPKGQVAIGIRGETIPKICEIWLDARAEGALVQARQLAIAAKAEMILRGLAHVGIIALIDEATGYQATRARKALEQILEAYISNHLAKWAKRFPDQFYKEMFRLKDWDFDEKLGKGRRPAIVGRYTKDIVYQRLAPGVLEELERLNPPNEHGIRKHRHHQWLTEDVGHPALRDHLMGVIALMRAARSWEEFMRALSRAYPRCDQTLPLALGYPDEE